MEQETDEMQLLEMNDASRETVSAEIKTSKLRLNLFLAKKCTAMKRMSSIVAGNLKLFAKFVNPSSFIIVCYVCRFFRDKVICLVVIIFCTMACATMMFDEVYPLWAATPVQLGEYR